MSFRSFARFGRIFAITFLVGLGLGMKPAAAYQFTSGAKMVYEVNIRGQMPSAIQTISGHLFYTIKKVDTDSGQATADFTASLGLNVKSTSSSQFGMPRIYGSFAYSMPRQIVLNAKGRVVENNGEDQLPFLLGNAWALPLEETPPADQNQWEIRREVQLDNRLRSFPLLPTPMQSNINWSAQEDMEYRSAKGAEKVASFDKKYELLADKIVAGQPLVQETGSGQIAFDPGSGWLKSMNMDLHLVSNDNGATTSMPVSVHLRLLSAAEAAQVLADQQTAMAAAAKAEAEREKPKLLDNDAINDALAKLKAVDSFRIQAGCEELAHAIVVKARQSEVAAALEPLLQNTDTFVRMTSAKALGIWAEKKNLPALESAVSSGDVFVKQAAIEALGHLPSARTADVVAKALPDMQVRMQAENALIKMGPVAEPSVLPLLKNPEWDVRLSACKILAAIGTQRSIPALQDVSSADHENIVIMQADKAVDAIRRE